MSELPPAKAAILDFNNTIVDAFSAFAALDVAAARDLFGRHITAQDVRAAWGSTPKDMYVRLFGGPPEDWERKADIFGQYRDEHRGEARFVPRLYPGALPALQRLRRAGLVLCLATGGTPRVVRADMRYNNIPERLFDRLQFPVGDDPKPLEPIVAYLGSRDISPQETVMVGDDEPDLVAARRARVGRFIAVETGVTMTRQQFEQAGVPPSDIVPTIADVPPLLLQ